MNKLMRIAAIPCLLLCATPAYAGPYADEFSKCLVKSTTADDQIVFMQWMFSAIALHPAVSNLSSITPEQREVFNKNTAKLFVRLMATDCRQQTIDALKYEGTTAIQPAFQLFGQAAMRGLMTNASVAAGLQGIASDFAHDEKWIALFRDAGISVPAGK